MTTLQAVLRSKTVWFNIIIAIIGILQGSVGLFKLTPIEQMYALIALATTGIMLRSVTSVALTDK